MRAKTRGPSFGHSALTASMRRQSSRGRALKICSGTTPRQLGNMHNRLTRVSTSARRKASAPRRSRVHLRVDARTAMSWSSVSSSTSGMAPAASLAAAVAGLHLARRALTRLADTAPSARCADMRPHGGRPRSACTASAAATARVAQPTRGAWRFAASRRAAPLSVVCARAVGVVPRTWHGSAGRRLMVRATLLLSRYNAPCWLACQDERSQPS